MTAEEFYNENFIPKDRKRFCKYELTQFAESYAEHENKALQKQVEELRDLLTEVYMNEAVEPNLFDRIGKAIGIEQALKG